MSTYPPIPYAGPTLSDIMAAAAPTAGVPTAGASPIASAIPAAATGGRLQDFLLPLRYAQTRVAGSGPGMLSQFGKPSGWGGWLGRGVGTASIYGGLKGTGGLLGNDNPLGYGFSSAALPAAGTFALTGAAGAGAPTIAGVGVPLAAPVAAGVIGGTALARLIPSNRDNSWGNVFENVQRKTGTYEANTPLPSNFMPSLVMQAYDENGNLDTDRLATILKHSNVDGVDTDKDGNIVLRGEALAMLETVRDKPEQYGQLAQLAAANDLTPEDMQSVDQTYMMALLTADDPTSQEARDQALGVAKLAMVDAADQRDQEKRFTEMALAYQTAAQQILAPVTASMDAQAQYSYNTMLSAASSLPPELQGIAVMQAQQQLAGSQMVSNAYRAQAATMMPALWLGQQQDQVNQLSSQLQPQIMAAGMDAMFGGGGAGGGMTLANIGGQQAPLPVG